jgi:sulfate/thiosulfate transport system substrate-binding protein
VKALMLLAGATALALLIAIGAGRADDKNDVELLNASYDVSRELFTHINPAFAAEWKKKTGQTVEIRQSHGGSSKQARAVAEGMRADVVTFNQATDVAFLSKRGLVAADWQKRLPNQASPYYSLPVFLVRGGNPKHIRDWNDLVRPGVQVVFPNPKTSGNGRYSYLSAYAYALEKNKGDAAKASAFVQQLLANVPVFDTGGRGATTTFIERQIGDVLITFESEVNAIKQEYSKNPVEVITPSVSVQADFPVAVVDKVVERHGNRSVATAYLQFLYSDQGQEILAQNYYRVRNPAIAARHQAQFPEVRLVSIEQSLGGWDKVMQTHFGDGGVLDQALTAKR